MLTLAHSTGVIGVRGASTAASTSSITANAERVKNKFMAAPPSRSIGPYRRASPDRRQNGPPARSPYPCRQAVRQLGNAEPQRRVIAAFRGHPKSPSQGIPSITSHQKACHSWRYFGPSFPAYDLRAGRTRHPIDDLGDGVAFIPWHEAQHCASGGRRRHRRAGVTDNGMCRVLRHNHGLRRHHHHQCRQPVATIAGPSRPKIIRGETWRAIAPARSSFFVACNP